MRSLLHIRWPFGGPTQVWRSFKDPTLVWRPLLHSRWPFGDPTQYIAISFTYLLSRWGPYSGMAAYSTYVLASWGAILRYDGLVYMCIGLLGAQLWYSVLFYLPISWPTWPLIMYCIATSYKYQVAYGRPCQVQWPLLLYLSVGLHDPWPLVSISWPVDGPARYNGLLLTYQLAHIAPDHA